MSDEHGDADVRDCIRCGGQGILPMQTMKEVYRF